MSKRKLVVLWAGNTHDGLPATDHHLARALSEQVDVLWVDPPRSVISGTTQLPRIEEVSDSLRVLRVWTPPGPSRPGLRQLAEVHQMLSVARALRSWQRTPWATISLSARFRLPKRRVGVRVLHVTDDWVAGSAMMGLDENWMRSTLVSNVHRADVVSAVSVDLGQMLQRMNPRHPVMVVPNGATLPLELPEVQRERVAVLMGQLNERLDVDLLDAVVDAGVPLRIMGPRTDRDAEQGARLDALLARPEVDWRGPVPHEQVAGLLAGSSVGLTPYLVNDFNRSSFPLKTLEYLAAGLPVVSTPLESLDWLGTDLVDVASGPADYAQTVRRLADAPRSGALEQQRRDFAREQSWQARAGALLDAIQERAGR